MRHLLTVFSCLCTGALIAQLTVTGTIRDEFSEPIAYATVLALSAADSTLVKGEVTDERGTFRVALPPGQYDLEISYVGYRSQSVTIITSTDLGTLTLEPTSAGLTEVTVTAAKPLVQRERDRLIVNVAGSILSQGNSALELLQRSPGVMLDQDDRISLNGRNGVRIYIDDKDTRLAGDQLTDLLRTLPANSVERIEIITNPSARYEAQGNAGIINIVTKQSKFYGTNGSLTLSPGRGRYWRWEHAVAANHRTERVNVHGRYSYANRNQYMEIVQDRSFLQDGRPLSLIRLQNDFRLPIESHLPRLGLDLTLSERTNLNFLYSGVFTNTGSRTTNAIDEFTPEEVPLAQQRTDATVDTRYRQHTGNVNFRHTFANEGVVDIDFDVARYRNGSDEAYRSRFADGDGRLDYADLLSGVVDGYFDLNALSLDYTLPLQAGAQLEFGTKNTWVTTDNDLDYQNTIDGVTTPNTTLSNRFVYRERINGAYVSYAFQREKWNAQLGLRGEYSFIRGDQLTTGEAFDNRYFNLFPSASVNYTASPDHVLGLSFSRRIDRPGYNQLNPFRFFINTNTFRVGNPFLRPQYTWSTEASYTFKQRYYLALNYGYTRDNLSQAIIREGKERIVSVAHVNIDRLQSYALTLSLPISFSKRWTSQWNVNGSVLRYDGPVNGFDFARTNPILMLNSNHNIDLGAGFDLQVGGFYLPPHYMSITRIESIWALNLGVQKNFAERKGLLRLSINDIFFQQYPAGRTFFGGIDDRFISYRDSRYATLAFTWNFGKMTVRPAQRRQNAIQDELNRARPNTQ